jgi:hypothetical protein
MYLCLSQFTTLQKMKGVSYQLTFNVINAAMYGKPDGTDQ